MEMQVPFISTKASLFIATEIANNIIEEEKSRIKASMPKDKMIKVGSEVNKTVKLMMPN